MAELFCSSAHTCTALHLDFLLLLAHGDAHAHDAARGAVLGDQLRSRPALGEAEH
jgi:hypothetical protein